MNCLSKSETHLEIALSSEDLLKFDLCAEHVNYADDISRAMLRFYIELAKQQTGFTEKRPTLLEVYPYISGGCIVKVVNVANNSISTEPEINEYIAKSDFNTLAFMANILNPHQNITLYKYKDNFALVFEAKSEEIVRCGDFTKVKPLTYVEKAFICEYGLKVFTGTAFELAKM